MSDDTRAFEAARAAAGAAGIIRVPSGTYLIAQISLDVPGQQWLLDPDATLKLKSAANSSVIVLAADEVRIRGGKIDGNGSNQASLGTCVAVLHDRTAVEDMEIASCRGLGIYIIGADDTKVLRNYIHDTAGAVFAEGGADRSVIDGNRIERTVNNSGGIVVHGNGRDQASVGSRITNNRVMNASQISIEVWGLAPDSHIEGNTTYGGTMGISADMSDRTVVSTNTVTAAPAQAFWIGLEIAGAKNVQLLDNAIDGSSAPNACGICVSNTAPYDNTMSGNSIVRTSKAIFLGGARGNSVVNNKIDGYAVVAVELGAADSATMTGNVILNGATGSAAIVLDNTNNAFVDTNTIRACDRAVFLYQARDGTTDGNRITNNRIENCRTPVAEDGILGTNNTLAGNVIVP